MQIQLANANTRTPSTHVVEDSASVALALVGTVTSPYSTRNGTPRQPSLVASARARISLQKNVPKSSLIALQDFSHAWVLFIFHQNTNVHKSKFKGTIKPPRLNGASVGVFSTRSPHRPAPIGLSLGRVVEVNVDEGWVLFHGLDLVHGTPVVDIKPYVSFSDAPACLLTDDVQVSQSVLNVENSLEMNTDEDDGREDFDEFKPHPVTLQPRMDPQQERHLYHATQSASFMQDYYAPGWVTKEIEESEPLAVKSVSFENDKAESELRTVFSIVSKKAKKSAGISLYKSEEEFIQFVVDNLMLDFRSTRERIHAKFTQYRVTLCDIVVHYVFVEEGDKNSVVITGAEVCTEEMAQPLNVL
ncbi:TsaA-like domain-containing protein [Chytriomyces sp. MP71]|nr:TsaA-like domain-containing protein [Chytriomyces sp. MP71]